jgi:predicted nucleic acid-binding protein
MDRLFLDANVLFSAAYRPAPGLLRLWKLPSVALCSSRYALEEARANLSTESQRSRLAELSGALELFESGGGKLPGGVSLPEKDAPILLAAVAAHATHLITGDLRHFGPLFSKRIAGFIILPPADYLRRTTSR